MSLPLSLLPPASSSTPLGLKDATVLSQCTIAAVSAASIVFNLPKRHPTNPDQTLIAYELLLTMTPALLMGVSIGVIFNVAFPTWLITTMLISLLAFMSTRTAQKGLQQWRGETQAQQQAAAAAAESSAAAEDDEAAPLQGSSSSTVGDSESGMGAVVVVADEPTAAAGSTGGKAGKKPYPWGSAAGVVFLWCGFGALQLLRQNTTRCSPAFYSVLAGQVGLRDPREAGGGGMATRTGQDPSATACSSAPLSRQDRDGTRQPTACFSIKSSCKRNLLCSCGPESDTC